MSVVSRVSSRLWAGAFLALPCGVVAQRPDAPCTPAVEASPLRTPAGADTGGARRGSSGAPRAETARPTVLLWAAVEAEELRFARQPRVCVALRGDVRLDSLHVLTRRNISSPVIAARTYRNVQVAVELLGYLDADCIAARITGASPDSGTTRRCADGTMRRAPPARAPAP